MMADNNNNILIIVRSSMLHIQIVGKARRKGTNKCLTKITYRRHISENIQKQVKAGEIQNKVRTFSQKLHTASES